MPKGYKIRVIAPPVLGGPSLQKIFHVAVDDENRAIEAVREVTKPASDAIIEVAGELSSDKIMRLGLKAGEVMPDGQTKAI
jgi:hypothetical protein